MGGFKRRFFDGGSSERIEVALNQPNIVGNDNDINRINNVLMIVRKKCIGLDIPVLTSARIKKIQNELRDEANGGPVTWDKVWRLILKDYKG